MHDNYDELNFETLAIHAANEKEQHQAINPPLYLSSSFDFTDIQQCDDTFSFKRKAYVYTRGGNPTVNLFENRIAALENGAGAVAFASGMAAVSSVLLSLLQTGDNIIAHNNLYGSSFSFITKILPRYQVKPTLTNLTNLEDFENLITPDTKVIFFETPTNPSLAIIDIKKITGIAKKYNIKVVVDNTFATPFLQKPLNLGADVVIHSATKFISGHGDVIAGVAIAKDIEYVHCLKFDYMCELGGVMSPFNAFLLLRGLKTLTLRMQQHEKNASTVANMLLNHNKITKVIYPGLSNHPQHSLAKEQMRGFGGVLSFELDGDTILAEKFIKKLHLPRLAVSLGDAETLIQIPALMTHRGYPTDELEKFGFSQKTIRISLGLENTEDIVADITQALNSL